MLKQSDRRKEQYRPPFVPSIPLLLLALLAAWPVLRAGMPTVGDGLNHFYRLVELDWAIRHGVFYPRWMPDLGYGYGLPLFVYYPPLAYYAAEVFRLFGFSFATAMLAAYAFAFGLAAFGAYLWGRDVFGEAGGVVTAAAYALAPYLYLDVLARGALPESLALGLLPWLFWAYRRFALSPGRRTFFAAVLLHTAFLLTHTLSAFLATPLVAVYLLLHSSVRQGCFAIVSRHAKRSAGRLQSPTLHLQSLTPDPSSTAIRRWSPIVQSSLFIASLLVPLLLSAFFWLPALLETRYVQAGRLFIPALDYHNNFVSVDRLLAAPRSFDPKLVFFDIPASLGWPQVGLALIALIGVGRWKEFGRKTHILGAWLALLVLAFLTLPASVKIWETLPLLRYLQFPWRLVGPASLMLAMAAGGGAQVIFTVIGERFAVIMRAASLSIVNCLLFLFSLPWTFTAGYDRLADPTVAGIARYEQSSGQLGTTSAGEYLPVGVTELPAPDSLAARYAGSMIIPRLDRTSLPLGATVAAEASSLTLSDATIDSPVPFTAVFDWFYFPGWWAEIDGKPASARPGALHGLIEVDVPAGRHTVAVQFGATPLRRGAGVVSLLTLIGVVAWGLRAKEQKETTETRETRDRTGSLSSLISSGSLIFFLLFRVLYFDRFPSIFSRTRFDGTVVAGVTTPLAVDFDHRLGLIGLDLPHAVVHSGEAFDFDLYWRPLAAPLDADYSIAAHLVDASGALFGQADSQHPSGVPTSRWRARQYALDRHRLLVLPGTPPGTYGLVAGVYRFDTGASLSVRDENDIPQGTTAVLAEITVTRPARFPTDAELAPAVLLDKSLGPLNLVGYDRGPGAGRSFAGSPLHLTLFWRANAGALPDLRARIELMAAGGAILLSEDLPPARADYPTNEWAPGEAVREPQSLRIPADALAGNVRLQLSLADRAGMLVAGPIVLDEIEIVAPERSTERPPIAHPLDVVFGGAIRLLGYDLEPETLVAGQPFKLTLYWESLAPVSQSYTVFTHLLDSANHIWAQKDSPPLNGARPTTGWLPGEVLTDVYEMTAPTDAPAGTYIVEAGLYDADGGARLPATGPDGQAIGDHLVLTESVGLAPR